jgi:hypothetical protein
MAPELRCALDQYGRPVDSDDYIPQITKASDVFGFSMAALQVNSVHFRTLAAQAQIQSILHQKLSRYLLQILTLKMPYHRVAHEATVICLIIDGIRPRRIEYDALIHPIMWSILESCWGQIPESRPAMAAVINDMSTPQFKLASM